MSFAEQERVLFDLLFDPRLLKAFLAEGADALASYALSDEERADFASIDRFGLETDARMRRDLMVQRLCRAFPLGFSIGSSLPEGLEQLRSLITPEHVRASASTRTALYGDALHAWFKRSDFASQREGALCLAILDFERGLAWAASSLRDRLLSGAPAGVPQGVKPAAWDAQPLALAPSVCVALLPKPYSELMRSLCPVPPEQLWNRLSQAPLPAHRLSETLAREQARLIVGRAVTTHASRCEVDVTHKIVELAQGFAPILHHVDGKRSARELMEQLRLAGADERLVDSVRTALGRLVDEGMLQLS
jgi:hypothetical protein